MKKTIVLLPGDGIGPEVTRAARIVLEDTAREFGHSFELAEFPIGGAAIDTTGDPLPASTVEACKRADAVFLGAVGGPRWDTRPIGQRPESGLLGLRQALGLYVNLRPIHLLETLREISPLKRERTSGIDLEIVRELAGGIYFGSRRTDREGQGMRAQDTESYSTSEIERVAQFAFARAEARSRHVTSVDKANVLSTSALWRKTVSGLSGVYKSLRVDHMYVDNAAMQLVLGPSKFDVILTSNMFGDILSDLAAALVGSIGLVPSASFGTGTPLFEPIHGSAPQLAGKDCANPIGAILSVAMLLRDAFGLSIEAELVEAALGRVLARGYRTSDIAERDSRTVGTSFFSEVLREEMQASVEHAERYGWGV